MNILLSGLICFGVFFCLAHCVLGQSVEILSDPQRKSSLMPPLCGGFISSVIQSIFFFCGSVFQKAVKET